MGTALAYDLKVYALRQDFISVGSIDVALQRAVEEAHGGPPKKTLRHASSSDIKAASSKTSKVMIICAVLV